MLSNPMLAPRAAAPETLEPLLDGVPARSDAEAPAAAAPTPAPPEPPLQSLSGPITLTIESLVPVRGHVVEATRSDTIAQLKVIYLEKLMQDSVALMVANAERGVNAKRASFSSESGAAFDTHVRLIFDGHELLDEMPLCDVVGLEDGSRVVALAQKQERGLGQRVTRALVRWWPLIAVVILATVFILEVRAPRRRPVLRKGGAWSPRLWSRRV